MKLQRFHSVINFKRMPMNYASESGAAALFQPALE
jgi:hypothetical protein